MELPHLPRDNGAPETRLTERISISLHLVLLLLVFTVWLIRLGDKVDANSKEIERLQRACAKHCHHETHDDER